MITPSFGLTATERVLPKLALDFTTASLDPRVTFTRTGNTATVTNSSGNVVSINADLPRFDYDPITLVCKGLLIEESRTNLLDYSSDFTNAIWPKNEATISPDVVVAPDGTLTGDKLVEDATTAAHFVARYAVPITNAASYTFSIYAKAAERNLIRLIFTDGFTAAAATISLINGSVSDGSPIVQSVGNGWWRISLTSTATRTGIGTVIAAMRTTTGGGSSSYAGDGTSGLYLWGGQFEAGAFATSYIPTEASQVTRTADVATMTGTNFSDWYNASEGAFAIKASLLDAGSTAKNPFGEAYNTATTNIYMGKRIGGSGVNNFQFIVNDATLQAFIQAASAIPNKNTFYTGVSAYKLDSFQAACDTIAGTPDTSGTVPTGLANFRIGSSGTETAFLNGHVATVRYWPQRLTNAEVQTFSKG
jgi:hypothetical protein